MVEFNNNVLIAVYVALGIYILYRILFRKSREEQEYEKLYNKILTSDKYKVKSQYDESK